MPSSSSSSTRSENEAPNKFVGTLPRALTEKKVVTAVKEDEDPDVIKERQDLANRLVGRCIIPMVRKRLSTPC